MKKLISILAAVMVLMCASVAPVEAKTTKASKSKSSSTARITRMYPDGYADVTGHTYKATLGKDHMNIRFGADGYAYFSGNGFKPFTMWWSYQGNGLVAAFIDGADSMDFYIQDDGKVLRCYGDDNTTMDFKLVK